MSNLVAVRPIYDDAALARLGEIFHASRGTPEGDERAVLAALVHDYERHHRPVEEPTDRGISPVEALRFHMERLGLRPKDLIPYMGVSSRVSEVLGERRNLTVEMVANLSRGLGIPADDLLP